MGELWVWVVLDGWAWWGGLDCGSLLHTFLDELKDWLWWGVVSWEVGLRRRMGPEAKPGRWWWWVDGGGLVHHLVEDLGWRRWRWWGVLDGYVGGVVVDDDLLGRGWGRASWGASEELGRLFVELRCSWGGAGQVVFHHSLVEDVGVVVGAGAGAWFRFDHDLRGVDWGLVDEDGAIRLSKVLGRWGRGQADHLVVVVFGFGFSLDPDLPDLFEVVFADVFEGVLAPLVWGGAWAGF